MQPVRTIVGGRRVTVYPPFRNGDALRLHRRVELGDIPFRAGTAPPVTRLPGASLQGKPTWPQPMVAADGLRIDVEGLDPEKHPAQAEAVAERVLRVIRFLTRQWWVGRGASESLSPLHNYFAVDSLGQPVERILTVAQTVIPWLGTERLLSQNELNLCAQFIGAGGDVPVSVVTLLDAVFATNHQLRPSAVLLAATACETLFSEQAYAMVGTAAKSTIKRAIRIDDLRQRVDRGAREVFGRSFKEERPDDYEALDALWIARHAVAHGSVAQQARNAVLHDQERFATAVFGAYAFFHWIANLRCRQWPDPMQGLVTPLARVDV